MAQENQGDDDPIKARAYDIWEREGRPHGQHEEHWHRASSELAEGSTPYDAGTGADGNPDASARSLGSGAQSDLIPDDAGQGSERAGSLVDTGPALGLVAGSAGSAGGIGNLSVGQEVGHGEQEGSAEAGGMASIGSGSEAGTKRKPSTRKGNG